MLRQTRNTYQHGWIETQPSKNKELVFVYRWRERKPDGGYTKRAEVIGRVSVLKTEANAWRAIEHRALEINSENLEGRTVSFGALINRYLEEDLPELRHSTAEAYRSYLDNRIMPRWGSYSIAKVKPFAVEQWLKELPCRTMAILDLATGLRCSELFALKWCDVVWGDLVLLVRRAIVDGIVSDVKTKYSKAGMPLDPALAEMLLNWQRKTLFKKPEDWVFASPFKAGKMPWRSWGVQQRQLAPAGIRCGIGRIGWHTFRHTFRSLLDETGAPMKVQQELMRHADIRTTMNVYGKAMDTSKREAHSKVVRLVLPLEER